ncbi:chemotaxis protein CheX [Texcoconibacillus texcoconensis]|uniref:Chemotaxis protein CheX n=1 Tax=Texcoconibacillus texcoconensis TaxID=1095777 RepID=A0A840QPP8_9BACI|nr:chemotaxis protein CheC [Texcoconibacillus texcoconensis]MBB5173318.1 chemotaxis protein CheX [Texcoconibacillus texcoconensis]
MNANHVNAVCRATESILTNHFGVDVTPLDPHSGKDVIPSNEVSVVLGVSGDVNGQIICSFTNETAKGIVGTMMGGMVINELDEMGWSAIQEFGNWIAGNTATELSNEACSIDVTPPVVNDGHSKFRSNRLFVTVPLQTSIGLLDTHISLKEETTS